MAAPRFVLLHSPLLGPMTWRPVAAELTRRGHAAEAPAWPRLSSVAEGFYPALADGLAAQLFDDGAPLTLVAHSGAGALIPALAARLGPRVAGVIFADALLPHPGRSWFDTAPAEMRERLRSGALMGDLPAWDEWWPPGALARLVPDAGLREESVAAGRYGWPLVRLPLHHLAMLTDPEPVAAALQSLAARLAEPAHG
jgi:pimeloyl-ACP methyl ester carboxylesterase